MDFVAEFAERYGAPRADTPWHELIALVKRRTRFQLRDRLILADGEELGRQPTPDDAVVRQMLRAKYDRLAWPEGA